MMYYYYNSVYSVYKYVQIFKIYKFADLKKWFLSYLVTCNHRKELPSLNNLLFFFKNYIPIGLIDKNDLLSLIIYQQ